MGMLLSFGLSRHVWHCFLHGAFPQSSDIKFSVGPSHLHRYRLLLPIAFAESSAVRLRAGSRSERVHEVGPTLLLTNHPIGCSGQSTRLTARTTDGVEKYNDMRTRARTSSVYLADTEAQTAPTEQARRFSTIILALKGGHMSQEHPSGNSNVKHRAEPNHPQQAEEVTTAGPTPNRF
ncbi:hypothetical protein B296_00012871 [Ensete ventricosum]|uniref:Uncharacterized protein n=1 Tax=Ensete ventricosum TaxID=4639 RepID=A0A426Z186_ENSVE|nr:hypothetical protein B296_00012871 [Ensete ventricosum]